MKTFLFIAVFAAVILLSLLKGRSGSASVAYRQKNYLLSKAERSFYGVLAQATAGNYLIFCKVRVADVLTPQKGLNRTNWQRAFNRISAKHIDFLLCDPADCSIKLAIELDDASHNGARRQQRDAFLDKACETASLPLLRIRAARAYGVADLRQQVEARINPESDAASLQNQGEDLPVMRANPVEPVVALSNKMVPLDTGIAALSDACTSHKPEAPTCHKCGGTMVLRKARTGRHAGESFWGCKGFPQCRGARKIQVDARGKT